MLLALVDVLMLKGKLKLLRKLRSRTCIASHAISEPSLMINFNALTIKYYVGIFYALNLLYLLRDMAY